MNIATMLFQSPVGPFLLVAREGRLVKLSFHSSPDPQPPSDPRDREILETATTQLAEYFALQRKNFDLPLDLRGTDFHQRVWQALLEIPYGETTSYGELAERIGSPGQARAVGVANGANPIAIIVPCHRVIGADGSLVGYGGGLERKQLLLDLESTHLSLPLSTGS